MNAHPTVTDLVERSDAPEVVAHLASCGACRARSRLVEGVEEVEPPVALAPGLLAARAAASRGLAASIGGGQLLHDDEDELDIGRRVERYVVEDRLGSGGMGTVYRVRHAQLGSHHALKLVRRSTRTERERLLREGRAQSRLRHPNLVPVTDVVDVDGAPGLILDLVEGPSLHELLRDRGPLPLDQADALARGILKGVAAAHRAGLVHRDLKPANVLLADTDGALVPKVTDFGLSRVVDASTQSSLATGQGPLGTPAYMAPEQVRDASNADARSDVFSLGALLFELVSGQRAFPGRSLVEVYDRVRAGQRDRLEDLVPGVPARWVAAIDQALSVDPADRFADAQGLLDAWTGDARSGELGSDVVGSPGSVGSGLPERVAPVAPAPTGRSRAPVAAGLAVAVVALLGGFWFLGPSWPERMGDAVVASAPAPEPVVERRLTARPADIQIFALALSPDGEEVAFTDARGVWRQRLEGGGATEVIGEGPFHDVDWLPGGQRLMVYGTAPAWNGVWTVGVDGSDPKRVFEGKPDMVRLSPDGTTLAVADATGLWLVDMADGSRRRVRPLGGADTTSALAWSPSGDALAAVHRSTDGSAWIERTRANGRETSRLLEDHRLLSLGLATLIWVEPDRLVFGLVDELKMETRWMALDGASTAPDASAARELHAWQGFQTTHVDATADGRRFVTARVVAQQIPHLLPLDGSSPARRLNEEAWSQIPVGWASADALWVRSSRGGGELIRQDVVGGGQVVEPASSKPFARIERVGDDRVFLGVDGDSRALEVARWRDGEVTRVASLEGAPPSAVPSHKRYKLRCRDRCLLSRLDPDAVRFFWVEGGGLTPADVGEVGEVRELAWDLSPDGARLALVSQTRGLVVRDLATGADTPWPLDFELPLEVIWSPLGDALFVAGLTFEAEAYRIAEVRPDGSRTLWASMSSFGGNLTPSADGRMLAFSAATFDDDLWIVDGLPGFAR